MRPALISVVVATYNWPAALDRVLASLSVQTCKAFEVIVADDGSRPDTAELVAAWKARMPVPLLHAWQADDGFRLSRVRNLSAAKASGDYLVFIDGDCITPPTFIEDHARLAERGWFVGGRRGFLSEEGTRRMLAGEIDSLADFPHSPEMFIKPSHAARLRRLPLGPLRKLRPLHWKQVEGCNMAVWKDDFLRVCGFDEAFRQYGHEDVDFAVRLGRIGLKGKWATFSATLLHLDHGRGAVGEDSAAALARIFAEDRPLPAASLFLGGTA